MGKIIGIDLGTTNSCVSVLEGKNPVVIPNSEGRNTTPSVVAFVDGGERKVGDPAKRQAITNPTRTVYSIKRFMGETYDQTLKETERVPYKVVNNGSNQPRVEIDGRQYTPQEISAMILQKMKKTAEDYLGTTVTDATRTRATSASQCLTWVVAHLISLSLNWAMACLRLSRPTVILTWVVTTSTSASSTGLPRSS